MKDLDEITFMIEHDVDMKHFVLTIVSESKMTPTEFVACLYSFAEEVGESPNEFFQSTELMSTGH